jgi:glutathione-regulated potassium-efflux system ancillary protein KefC
MIAVWIVGALLLGLAVSRIGLPPLVGFLASGFVFAALGYDGTPALNELAHAGVLLLLLAVGLKLRIKTLLRYEVWGTAISHLLLTGILGVAVAAIGGWLSPGLALALAISFGFSSTVLAAKVLDGNRELRAVHGRVAIGILIVQDVVAVVMLAFVNAETPSPYAAALLLLPFARPVIA